MPLGLRVVSSSPTMDGAAQSVERPALDFSSGHDLRVCEFEPRVGLCVDGVEAAWDSLSLSLSK